MTFFFISLKDMRIFLIAVFTSAVTACFGQLSLSHGDVYDYNVGDQFLVHRYSAPFNPNPSSPPDPSWDERTTVLSKTVTPNGDTVKYGCLVETNYMYSHLVQSGSAYVMKRDTTFSQQNMVLSYTDLNSSIRNYPYPPNQPVDPCYIDSVDTITYASHYCGLKTWHKAYTGGPNCFEPSYPNYDYVEGCGGPYYQIYDYSQGATMFRNLTYFKKGNTSCGNNIVMAVEGYPAAAVAILYPNPVQNTLFIKSSSPVASLSLYSASGSLVLHVDRPQQPVDVSMLARGLYCAMLCDGQGRTSAQKIIME